MLFGKFKGLINEVKLGFKAGIIMAKEPEPRTFFFRRELNEYGYIHQNSTKMVYNCKSIIGVLRVVEFDNDEIIPIIYTDWNFDNLSINCKKFTIAHELGHAKNWKRDKNFNASKRNRNFDIELEADLYAVDILGIDIVLDGMDEFISFLEKINPYSKNTKEAKERKAKLIELCK